MLILQVPSSYMFDMYVTVGQYWVTHCVYIQDEHPAVAETAVVGYPHDIKGEGQSNYSF